MGSNKNSVLRHCFISILQHCVLINLGSPNSMDCIHSFGNVKVLVYLWVYTVIRQNHQHMNSVLQTHVLWQRPGRDSLLHFKGQRATLGIHLWYPVPITPGQLKSNSKSCFDRARADLNFSKGAGGAPELSGSESATN